MDVTEPERGNSSVAPVLMALGGAIGAAGSFLTWASATIARGANAGQGRLGGQGGAPAAAGRSPGQGAPQGRLGGGGRSFTIHGLDTTGGRLVLALFIALVVVAIVGWLASRFWFRLGAMALGLVLGVIVLVLAVTDLASPDSLFGAVGTRLATAGLPVTVGVGLWLVLAGAVLAVGAAVFWLAATRRSWAQPAQASHPAPAPAPPSHEPSPAEQPTTPLPPLTEPGMSSE
jgi:hypothetical protein